MSTLDMDSINDIMLTLHDEQANLPEGEEKDQVRQIAFGYYHLIRRYQDVNPDFDPKELKKRTDKAWQDRPGYVDAVWRYFEDSTMSIEILKGSLLQKAYFDVRDKTVLREEVKERFKYEVDRSSPTNKLREFLLWSRDIMEDIKYQKTILSVPLLKFFVKGWYWFIAFTIIVSFLIALMVLSSWIAPDQFEPSNAVVYISNDSSYFTSPLPRFRTEMYPYITQPPGSMVIEHLVTVILGIIHNVLSLVVLISFFLNNNPRLPTFSVMRNYTASFFPTGQTDDDDEEEKQHVSQLKVQFFSFTTFYYLLFFVMSILGTVYYGYFFCFHLLHITQNNQLLKRVLMAVTRNGPSLLWVFVLGLVFLYIYSLIVFALFRDLHDPQLGMYCGTMYECFINLVHKGMILSTLEMFWEEDISGKTYPWHIGKFALDFSFFIIITTIGLNIIFGIIVDTFSELRDSKWQIDQDMRNSCFICSRESYDFEHHPGGFEKHVKHEHCLWAYLFFFIHLSDTKVNDYSALELYVYRLLCKDSINFFPLNRAMSLEDEEDTNEAKIETLLEQVTYIVDKMKEQEMLKHREQEEKKQQEWVQRFTS